MRNPRVAIVYWDDIRRHQRLANVSKPASTQPLCLGRPIHIVNMAVDPASDEAEVTTHR